MPNLLRRTFVLACLLASFQAYADDAGTTDEAKAMALRAADFLRQEGPEKAFPVFNDKTDGRFHDRDLYVMVYDTTGTNVAHGANAALIGKNLIDLKDTSGKLLIRELVSTKDQAFVDYTWPHPVTKKILPKSTYVVRVGNYLIGVGAYK